jgi:hypothetical protein
MVHVRNWRGGFTASRGAGSGASLHPGLRQGARNHAQQNRGCGGMRMGRGRPAHRTSIRCARLSVQRTAQAGMERGLAQQLKLLSIVETPVFGGVAGCGP